MFVRIEGKKGYGTEFTRRILHTFRNTDSKRKWIVKSDSSLIDKPPEKALEEFEMTDRGEILRCIKGETSTKHGKVTIKEWTRSPFFPASPVKPGDKWTYDEKMKTELDSFWISRESKMPDSVHATSTFKGFAKLRGRICALIVTNAVQKKRDTLETLMKKLTLNVTAYVNETLYFDFRKGVIVGRKVNTDVFSMSDDLSYSDMSKSQTVTILSADSPLSRINAD